ncbi:(2Fe-2S)-binding protein, partial [Klebsiella pneumoniae]|uniref:(2Fe-2S)-binding protein n=1 Tax=Klebsiella pneumoniae TaxID=573 RepID=UPI003B97E049
QEQHMYLCSCKAVTDGQIKRAVEDGCATWKELVRLTHVSTQCGSCGIQTKKCFDDCKAEKERRKTSQQENNGD